MVVAVPFVVPIEEGPRRHVVSSLLDLDTERLVALVAADLAALPARPVYSSMLLQLAHAIGQRGQDRGPDVRVLGEQAVELARAEDQQPYRRLRGGGRGAPTAVEQRDLPEEVAGAERVDLLTVTVDPHLSLDDQEELVRQLALVQQQLVRRQVDLVGEAAHVVQTAAVQPSEQGDPRQHLLLGVHARTSRPGRQGAG